jgi:uncharacterized protein (TIGR00369 family)
MQPTDVADRPGWSAPSSTTIDWYDPVVALAEAQRRGLSGIEFFQAMIDEELSPPPITALFGMRMESAKVGEVVFACTPHASALNPMGGIHGGLVCTLLDSVLGCAAHTTLPAATLYTSIELKVSYLRPVLVGGEIRARGWVTKPGRRVCFAEGEVLDAGGKVVATASSSILVMPAPQ